MIRRPPRSTLFPSTPLFRSQVERDRQAEAAVTGGTDPHPRGDGRVGGVEFTTARHRQEGGLKAGGVPDSEQLLRISTWPALAAHLLRDGQLDGQAPVGGPAMSRPPSTTASAVYRMFMSAPR